MTDASMQPGTGRPSPPYEIRTLAHERRAARLARDWAAADRLKAEIEAGGWRVVDRGPDFALVPASLPDLVVDGVQVYGSVENVPTVLDVAASPGTTILIIGRGDVASWLEGVAAVRVVTGPVAEEAGVELVRVGQNPTIGEALEAGLRRVRTAWVVIAFGAGSLPDGLFEEPLDASVAVLGTCGARTGDLHHFEPTGPGDADLLLAGGIGARREDLVALLPFDGRIVSADRFAQWLSLALRRDAQPDATARRAVVVAEADLDVAAARAGGASEDRASKRDFYRILDRFGLDPALLTIA